MRWLQLAPHSRASLAEALTTVTTSLTRLTTSRPPAHTLRPALYGHAFNPRRRNAAAGSATARALGWLERASLPVQDLHDPHIIRLALDALAVRLDGHPAAANTIARKRAVFNSALAFPAELGLLPSNPARPCGLDSTHRQRRSEPTDRFEPCPKIIWRPGRRSPWRRPAR